MRERDPAWYRGDFFRDYTEYAETVHGEERTRAEVEFALEALALPAGARILDLGCGHGRHSLELARRGFRVTGLDLQATAIEKARAAATAEGLEVEFVVGDMREPPGEAEFDAVLCLCTAFGCLERPEEDEKVVRAVARALRPGGAFLLETNNLPWLLRHFANRNWDELDDGSMRLFENAYDAPTGRLESRWIRLMPDGERREFRLSFRIYLPAEIGAMCERAGLAIERLGGSLDGEDWGIDSRRMVVLARRR